MRETDTTREIIVRLLSSMSSRKEVSEYLKQYASVDSRKFAMVKVGGGVLQDMLEELASALTFLQRVGLYPIVIHGGGPQLNTALAEAGIETRRVDGMRVTDAPTLEMARKVFQRENLRLVEALESMGTRARPVLSGVFEASYLDRDQLGFVGDVAAVHLEPLSSAVRSGTLPIVAPLGETPDGQIVNINADVAARELAIRIEPFKIVFLTKPGGLLDNRGKIIDSVNLSEEYERLMQQDWVHSGMRLKLEEIHGLLQKLPLSSSVSMTRADQLTRELFTHQGSGTLIRRGEPIHTFATWDGVDLTRLQALLETCFGRTLDRDYFERRQPLMVYLSDSCRATAVVVEQDGIPYLDKFAVTPKAQGEGLGRSLWLRMIADYPALFWRSRTANPINRWYFEQSSGAWRGETWTVFWCGIERHETIQRCIECALSIPATLH